VGEDGSPAVSGTAIPTAIMMMLRSSGRIALS